jgi:opacity protein-like surface antigen
MKKLLYLTVIALCTIPSIHAQDVDISSESAKLRIGDVDISVRRAPFMKGDWELSLSGAVGKYSSETSTSGGDWKYSDESSRFYATLSLTAGYFLIDRLSLEPEVNFFTYEGGPPAESIILNLSYTHPFEHSIIALFIRGGYGLGNGSSVFGISDIPVHSTDGFKVKTVNAGTGVKLLVAQNVALRIELNYQYQFYTQNYGNYSSFSTDNSNSTLRLCFGFSILP